MSAFSYQLMQAGRSQFAEVEDVETGSFFSVCEEIWAQLDGIAAAKLQQHASSCPADNGNDDISVLMSESRGL